jgi:hypothetical protein
MKTLDVRYLAKAAWIVAAALALPFSAHAQGETIKIEHVYEGPGAACNSVSISQVMNAEPSHGTGGPEFRPEGFARSDCLNGGLQLTSARRRTGTARACSPNHHHSAASIGNNWARYRTEQRLIRSEMMLERPELDRWFWPIIQPFPEMAVSATFRFKPSNSNVDSTESWS